MQLTLTYIKRYQKTSKSSGKPFTSVSIKAKEYGDKFISGFGNKINESWKEGDTVEVLSVDQKGDYLNFEMAKFVSKSEAPSTQEIAKVSQKLDVMNPKLDAIIAHLSGTKKLGLTSAGTPVPFPDEPPFEEDPFAGIVNAF